MTSSSAAALTRLPTGLRLGAVELTVAELGRSVAWWEQVIGLTVLERAGGRAALGARNGGAEALLVLVEAPGAPPADGWSGLYHVALLTPDRPSLARWLAHVARERLPLSGMSDHFVSEAIYLRDPDHHGVEVYADRPRALWEGRVEQMGSKALDTASILAELADPLTEPFDGMPAGTTVGHVHLRVAEIPATVAWYRDVLGFDLMMQYGAEAAFLAAGGYHHHVGANTWESLGRGQAPAGSAGLRQATIILPGPTAVGEAATRVAATGQEPEASPGGGVLVRDPSGNKLLLAAA